MVEQKTARVGAQRDRHLHHGDKQAANGFGMCGHEDKTKGVQRTPPGPLALRRWGQVRLEECCQLVEWNLVHTVVQVHMDGARNDHEFFGLRGRRIGGLAEVARMRLLAVDQEDGPRRDLLDVAEDRQIHEGHWRGLRPGVARVDRAWVVAARRHVVVVVVDQELRVATFQHVGAAAAAASAPDGYTILCLISAGINQTALRDKLPYTLNSFVPIAGVGGFPLALAVATDSKIKTIDDLKAHARSSGGVKYSSGGVGTMAHLTSVRFLKVLQGTGLNVAYKNNPEGLNALMGGFTDMIFASESEVAALRAGGKIRALAVTSSQRGTSLPDVPTMRELGFPSIDPTLWHGFMAPAGTPADIVAKLAGVITKGVKDPEFQNLLKPMGFQEDIRAGESLKQLTMTEKSLGATDSALSTSAKRLHGRRIVITGAASGIGRTTAKLFAQEGASLALLDRDERGLAETARETGGHAFPLDVTNEEAVSTVIDKIGAAMGGIDGVVNAAGIMSVGSVAETPVAIWRKTLEVNLTGTYIVTRACLRFMSSEPAGTIVNIASAAGLLPSAPGLTAYAASKGGVVNLTRALAAELAPRIRANSVCPGMVDTPMADGFRANVGNYALKRLAAPEEIARAILFLTSADSSYVTGAALAADGGRSFH